MTNRPERSLGFEVVEERLVMNVTVRIGEAGQGLSVSSTDGVADTATVAQLQFNFGNFHTGDFFITSNTPIAVIGQSKYFSQISPTEVIFNDGVGTGSFALNVGGGDSISFGPTTIARDLIVGVAAGGQLNVSQLNAEGRSSFFVYGGATAGQNNLDIENSHFVGSTQVYSSGNNNVKIAGSAFGASWIYRGSKAVDHLTLANDTSRAYASVHLLQGDDSLSVTGSTFFTFFANGDTGANTLTQSGNTFRKLHQFANFS